tara:strand:- start:662 stop:877 length:216 start_codon:yes stop_codon:yes gene_type:complete
MVSGYPAWQIPIVAYTVVLLLHGFLESFTRSQPSLIVGVPIMLFLLHTTFSIGLLDGFLRKGRPAKDRVTG